MKKLNVLRISSKDLPKIDDPNNIINPEYKKVRKYFNGDMKVKYITISKYPKNEYNPEEEVVVDITYSEPI